MARSDVSRSRLSPRARNRALYTWLRRASMAQTISLPSIWARGQAMEARVEQGAHSLSPGQASPFAVATPMRSPVKEPGPAATAITSASSRVCPQFFSMSCTMGSRVRLWVRPLF